MGGREDRNEGDDSSLVDYNSLCEHTDSQHVMVESMRLKNRGLPANRVEMAGPVFA